jgi:peptidoglycan/LPS O-acetylase OafA/YrhL
MRSDLGTVGDRLASKSSTGFDYLRIGLATSVVLVHSFQVAYGPGIQDDIANSNFHFLVNSILPVFFALSGFLVAGSLERNNLVTFGALRVLRIVPALGVEILLSALIIGAIFTALPLADYFSSPGFWVYFLNIVGVIHQQLPGVFGANPYPDVVNISLWTIPFELECYIALAVLSVVFRRSKVFFLIVPLAIVLIATAKGVYQYGIHYHHVQGEEHHLGGRALVVSFLFGVNVYLWRDKLPYSDVIGILCLVSGFVLISFYRLQYSGMAPLAYATVWIGLKDIPRSFVIDNGDYSYGVYLFASPIQQMLATFAWLQHWWLNFGMALCGSLLYASFSWHCIEKPILARKSIFTSATNRWFAVLTSWRARGAGWQRTPNQP